MTRDTPPPIAIDAEEAFLGACLLFPEVIPEGKLTPEMFYKDSHKKIFKAIIESSDNCDIISVSDNLRKKGELDAVGGPVAITKLTDGVFTDKKATTHALIIKEKYLLRQYISIGQSISARGYTEDLADVAEFAESELFKLSDFTQVKEPKALDKCIDELIANVEKIYNKEESLIGVPSGFHGIDRFTGGWQPSNLIIIAGRPSMGKTSLALTLALNAAKLKYSVCLFSLEMSENELATRFMSGSTGYTNVEIRNAKLNFDKFVSGSYFLANLPIYIDDTPAITLFELKSKVKKMIIKYGIKLVIIDYLQLMKAEAKTREQEVSVISRGLKSISKEFNVPVIALSQLNREVEGRADKRPRLSDLRESGAIEQDADLVCFVYRPILYGEKTQEIDKETVSTENLMIFDCVKDRSGALFSKALYHNLSLTIIQENKFEQ